MEEDIEKFWNDHPCGEEFIGDESFKEDYERFFLEYDRFRYSLEGHIPFCLDSIGFQNKEVLEIGLGQGADSQQIIEREAIWSGIDLTNESVERVRTRLKLFSLPFKHINQGSVTSLPFDDNSFDIVYSHGVLHHVPDIEVAQREIWRVLRPNGILVAMLYAKHSLNYFLSINIIRRIGLILLYGTHIDLGGIYRLHLSLARQIGLFNYLKMKNFIHRNTDGPNNPYSKVYTLADVREDFTLFRIEKAFKQFMYAPPLPVKWLPFQRQLGWHLWVYLRPRLGGER